tara:strand:+ start:62 stop:244 length:183 start_codon:yes stop_codon:yes gene_type:complete
VVEEDGVLLELLVDLVVVEGTEDRMQLVDRVIHLEQHQHLVEQLIPHIVVPLVVAVVDQM